MRVQGAERAATLALSLVGLALWVLHLIRPESMVLCYQEPCPAAPRDMTGVWGYLIAVVLAVGASVFVVANRYPRWHVPLLSVAALALVVAPVVRFIMMIVRVRREPATLLIERLAGIGPLDAAGVVIGLALLICALLVWATAGRPTANTEPALPVLVGTGCAVAAAAVALVPAVPEWTLTGPLLAGQYLTPGWYPAGEVGISMPAGTRNAALLMWLLGALLGVATQAWTRASAALGRAAAAGWGLAGCVAVAVFLGGHLLIVEGWHQSVVDFYVGPFTAAAQSTIAVLGAAMVACVLAQLFWPRTVAVAEQG